MRSRHPPAIDRVRREGKGLSVANLLPALNTASGGGRTMKRSEINEILREGKAFLERMNFHLPAWAHWSPED